MRFQAMAIEGVWCIEPDYHGDERGWFARFYCDAEFARHGLIHHFPQHSMSMSRQKATLRGLHLQTAPHAEVKLVGCVQGAIFDVVVDYRPQSPTFLHWIGCELNQLNGRQLYIPEGCAHGFQTLSDDALVRYMISTAYAPDHATGLRYDDPAIGIEWPMPPSVMSEKDRNWGLIS